MFVLSAHDAADLAIAALADVLTVKLPSGDLSLMKALSAIENHLHTALPNRDFFRQLNDARNAFKHSGVRPDSRQFGDVAADTYNYLSEWLDAHAGIKLDDVDEASLIEDAQVKQLFEDARGKFASGEYKAALEKLAIALHLVFERSQSLWTIEPGSRSIEDAVRLSGLGVRLNDFLALQHFMPEVIGIGDADLEIRWDQTNYGHPGNWTEANVQFCLDVFLHLVVHIQHVGFVPWARKRDDLYDAKLITLVDGVKLFEKRFYGNPPSERDLFFGLVFHAKPTVVFSKTLAKGESIIGSGTSKVMELPDEDGLHDVIEIWNNGYYIVEYDREKISVVCVPKVPEHVRPGIPSGFVWEFNDPEYE